MTHLGNRNFVTTLRNPGEKESIYKVRAGNVFSRNIKPLTSTIKSYTMKKIIVSILIAFIVIQISCEDEKENAENDFKQEKGTVWLSGGLAHCAEQIHLDNGDTLVVHDMETIYAFKSGDRVSVNYVETGINNNCYPYIDCELMDIERIN